MKRLVIALIIVSGPWAAARSARANLAKAQDHLTKGEYQPALAEFRRVARGASRGPALLGQARTLREIGKYAQAARAARLATRVRAVQADAEALYAEILLDTGKYQQAIRHLERVVKRDAKAFHARAVLGRAYALVGKTLKAGVIWKDLFRDWDNGLLDKKRADHTYYVGLAGQGDKNWQYASDAYEQALKIDPKRFEINLRWGWLFMSKFNVPDAEKCFKDILKYNPNHADAWAGWAWVEWYAARPKRRAGMIRAEKALKINPNNIEAMLYLAALYLFDAEYGKALILAERALKVNPNHLRALAHLAAVHFLRDKSSAFRQIEVRALKVNPRYSDFYYLVSQFASRHHLYKEAAALNKKGKALDPNNANVLAALGVALLRTGEEGEGIFWLKEAWKQDKFNHQTMNLLNLYDDIPKKYTTIKAGRFKIRMAKDEVKTLKRYVPQYLNKVLSRYMKMYQWTPRQPIMIELYEDDKEFTVRTFGEPAHGGILGVCFGPVITAMSPSMGRANWAMVLHHELAHTVHIAISRSRVPRWFTEGLAEYETNIARSEWRREHRLDVYRAIQHRVLPPIEKLNLQFTHAKTPKGVVIAYFLSSEAIHFIVGRWGYKAVNKALRLFAKNKTTAEVIPAITGLSTADFDKQFVAFLRQRYRHYVGKFDPLSAQVVPLSELESRAKAAPRGARAQADLAVGYLINGRIGEATGAIDKALKLHKGEPIARFLKAELALRQGRRAEAKGIYQSLIKQRLDGYSVRMRLGALARRDKNWNLALKHYAVAKRLDPERTGPYDARIQVYAHLKKNLRVVQEMMGLATLKESSGSLLFSILTRAAKLKRWDIVRQYGRLAVDIQPLNFDLHEKYAWALKAGRKHRKAIFEFESALATVPDVMPPARRVAVKQKEAWIYLGIAECWAALRERDRALRSVRMALSRNSNLTRAIQLRKRLDPRADSD